MTKFSSSIIAISLGLIVNFAMADDGGSVPGYVYTPTSGSTVVKSAYGQCVHNAYWEPSYGLEECGEAPEVPAPAPAPAPVPKVIIETITMSDADTVLFDFNKPTLTPAANGKLAGFVSKFKESGDVTKITVNGYTDAIGNDEYNKKLSQDRAQTIKDFFVANGFSAGIITAQGLGKQDAKASANCIQKFGTDHYAEINKLKAKLKSTKSLKAKKQLKQEIAKLEENRNNLIACAASDRRVVLLVEHTQQVKKQVMPADSTALPTTTAASALNAAKVDSSSTPSPTTGKILPEIPIQDTGAESAPNK